MARSWAMYGSTPVTNSLEETEAHRRSPSDEKNSNDGNETTPRSSGASRVDGTTSSTAAGLSPDVWQEEVAQKLCQQAEDMQEKRKGWKMLVEIFKELEKKRDEREKEHQQRMIELKEASTWGQKLHRENGELLKQANTHKTLISLLSVEVEEEKKKSRRKNKKYEEMGGWSERRGKTEKKNPS
ncbi:hypothetical protein Dimus_024834 [Dionaea muscipula]